MESNFDFGNALHISKTRYDKMQWAFVIGILLILFSSIVLLIFNGEKNVSEDTWRRVLIICLSVIAIGVLLPVSSIVITNIAYKKRQICFAIFTDYILISNNLNKDLEIKQIFWNDISEYSFNEHHKGDDVKTIKTTEGRFNIGGYGMNYGGLRIISGNIKFETNIDNINEAKELFKSHCSVTEKFDSWNDIKT